MVLIIFQWVAIILLIGFIVVKLWLPMYQNLDVKVVEEELETTEKNFEKVSKAKKKFKNASKKKKEVTKFRKS